MNEINAIFNVKINEFTVYYIFIVFKIYDYAFNT